ncbi:MAG: hypothetical protein KTR20_02370 [Cellvibrionaceae bacterium]|nr:hypothetical protein [Cellvibrionaceae bacterium]
MNFAIACLLWVLIFSVNCLSATAEDNDFFLPVDVADETPLSADSRVSLKASIGARWHFSPTQQRRENDTVRQASAVSASRLDGFLQLDYRHAEDISFRASVDSTYDVAAQHRRDMLDETYMTMGSGAGWSLKFGRQLWVLGEADYHRLLDVVNPFDEREPGLAEADALRLPLLSTRISYAQQRWGVDLLLLQEFRRNSVDQPGGDFDPFIDLRDQASIAFLPLPSLSLWRPDWAARLLRSQSWGDVSLVLSEKHAANAMVIDTTEGHVLVGHPLLHIAGFSVNYIHSAWRYKAEFAYQRGHYFLRDIAADNRLSYQGATEKKSIETSLLGVAYTGLINVDINAEIYQRRITDYNTALVDLPREFISSFDLNYYFFNDKLGVNVFWNHWFQGDSDLVRVKLTYDYADNTALHIGYIDYVSRAREGVLAPYQHNDRLFAGVKYTF